MPERCWIGRVKRRGGWVGAATVASEGLHEATGGAVGCGQARAVFGGTDGTAGSETCEASKGATEYGI